MVSPGDRPMLIFVSDIHLTDSLHNSSVPRKEAFERFWTRIQAARGKRPAHLCFVGDLFDIVRSPTWLTSSVRPYHDPGQEVSDRVCAIVESVLQREAEFFGAIRRRVQA